MPDEWTPKGHGSAAANSELAAKYLQRGGLTFDFASGDQDVEYRIAIGEDGPTTIRGDEHRDYLWGLAGSDRLLGGAGDDVLHADRGDDVLFGGMGSDALDGGHGDDSLYGGAGADNLIGRDGNDLLDEGPGHSMVTGGMGNDTLIGGAGPDAFTMDRTSGDDVIRDFTAGPGMFDHLALRDLRWDDLTIEGVDGGVLVRWEGGSVLLEGVQRSQLAQDDFMFADAPDLPPGARRPDGPGDERIVTTAFPEAGKGAWIGGEFDRAADKALKDGSVSFDFHGDTTYRLIAGRPTDDDRGGGETSDHIFGRNGDDRYIGYGGDDDLNGDAGNDRLDGGSGMDRLDGGVGNDTLFGGNEMDELIGGSGKDYLDEGAGHGMLNGGMGDDYLVGGPGADAFMVMADSGNDVVADFEAGGAAQGAFDHIAFQDIMPNQVSVAEREDGTLVSWSVDNSPGPDGSVLLLGVAAGDLRQSDFMFGEAPGFVNGVSDAGSWYIFS